MAAISGITRCTALLGWISVGAALVAGILPAPERTLAVLMIGAAGLVGFCATAAVASRVGLLAAALLTCAVVALAVSRTGPAALHEPDSWAPALTAAALVLGAGPLGTWAASGLTPPGGLPALPEPAAVPERPLVSPRPFGLRRLEAEMTWAAEQLSDLSVALLGIDGEGEGDEERVMRLLDQAVVPSLTPSDLISEYGPTERLLLLPGVSAPALRAGAAHLCATAAERVGRPVRAALATFPADGSSPRFLLDRLELSLAEARRRHTAA